MFIINYHIGFIEVPNLITLNVYTVGCQHNCPNCHTKDLQNFNHPNRKLLKINEFLRLIDKHEGFIQGVAWLGGDPIEQEQDLVEFASSAKKDYPNIKQILYTGYEFKDLPSWVLAPFDIIIDGKFNGIPVTDDNTNQKIYIKDNGWKVVTYKQLEGLFI